MIDFWNWKKPFRSIKFAFQRMKKGYCDYDTWDIDSYLDKILPGMLRQMARETISAPVRVEDGKIHQLTDDEWKSELRQAALMIEMAMILEDECIFQPDQETLQEYAKRDEAATKSSNKYRKMAFDWLLRNYRNLWW